MLSNIAEFQGILPEVRFDGEDMGLIMGLADLGARLQALPDHNAVRRTIVREAAPGIARLVARDLSKDPRARRLVMQSYVTGKDPMADYRAVAAHDYFTVLDRTFPEYAFALVDDEDDDESEEAGLVGHATVSELADESEYSEGVGELGKFSFKKIVKVIKHPIKISKKTRKRLKKVGKVVAIGAVVAGAVALAVVTGGAAVPLLVAVGSQGMKMQQEKKKAQAEKKSMKQAEAELAAMNAPIEPPPPGELAETSQAAFASTAAQLQGNPVAQGSIEAQGQIVKDVIPSAMASYAAGQVAGRTREDVAAELGVRPEEVSEERLAEANAVASGADPTKATPGWALPAAIGGGGLLVALATGVI